MGTGTVLFKPSTDPGHLNTLYHHHLAITGKLTLPELPTYLFILEHTVMRASRVVLVVKKLLANRGVIRDRGLIPV